MANVTIIKKAPRTAQSGSLGATHLQANGLNPHLLASISLAPSKNDATGELTAAADATTVIAVLEDGEFALENQYSTPFESSNPEGRMPNLMGMLQSGLTVQTLTDVLGAAPVKPPETQAGGSGEQASGFWDTAAQNNTLLGTLEGLKGRSTFTKINSYQIYTSSNSVRITGTLVFAAWENAKTEVEAAVKKLQEWTAPELLADKSALVSGLTSDATGLQGFFPSLVPPAVTLKYGGKTYSPLVIESLSAPITAPMTSDGSRISIKCQITLVSRTAWDKADIQALYGG